MVGKTWVYFQMLLFHCTEWAFGYGCAYPIIAPCEGKYPIILNCKTNCIGNYVTMCACHTMAIKDHME
jgi:hypothetical protein